MKLKDLFDVLGSGEWLRIGTEHGNGWLYHDRTIHLDTECPDWLKEREVFNVHTAEARGKSRYCKELQAGIAITVVGEENGNI